MTTQLKACFFTLHALKAGLCALLTAGMLMSTLAFPASAQPDQNPAATTESAGNAAAASQLAEMLTSPVAEERVEALQQVTDLAYHRPEVDLSPTVPVLVEIYESDPEERYRLAAVAALHAIGDESGMQQVRRLVFWESSRKVRGVALGALLDYYGPLTFEDDEAAAAVAEEQLERILEARQEDDRAVVAERQ